MGRGLSDLQGTILCLALANREEEGRTGNEGSRADVYHAQVLAEHFGWEAGFYRHGGLWEAKGAEKVRGNPGGHHFLSARIGAGRYNAAHAALTRAFARLEARGLIVRVSGECSRWSGANLTPKGVEQARGLTVNAPANLHET